jgi:hypothetical protein
MDIGEIVYLNNGLNICNAFLLSRGRKCGNAGHGSMLCNLPRKIQAIAGCGEWKEYMLFMIEAIPEFTKVPNTKYRTPEIPNPRFSVRVMLIQIES